MNNFSSRCNTISHLQKYECQVIKNNIAFDGCLWQELNWLWTQGIETVGSCCGQHIDCDDLFIPYIQVKEKCFNKMLGLGYDSFVNEFGKTLFLPKTIFIRGKR